MRIKDTCPCGATFEVDAVWWVARHQHLRWLEKHAPCREANMIVMASQYGGEHVR